METQLDKLQFKPSMIHFKQALEIIGDGEGSLSLFRWAKRQSRYVPSDECYVVLFDTLNKSRNFNGIQGMFDEFICDSGEMGVGSFINKGLSYKAFEVYESMEAAGCSLDGSTYEIMIPSPTKSGRLDAASKLFQEMKSKLTN